MEPNMQAAMSLIKEAKECGKVPWCCCAVTERYVYELLNPMIAVQIGSVTINIPDPKLYPQETFEETKKRRNGA